MNNGEPCVICGEKTYVVPICKKCQKMHFEVLENLKLERCSMCGKPLISTKGLCLQCRESPVLLHTDLMLPLFPYLLWNKELLFLWKINEVRSLSAFFARKVAEALWRMEIQFIVPVPPRPGKIQQKGWDQIDELCQFLSFRFGFKILNLLERVSVQEQKKLNRENRLEQTGSAYVLISESKQKKVLKPFHDVLPQEVCIIDDVCTTGATIEKCASLLKQGGIKKVDALTIFVV